MSGSTSQRIDPLRSFNFRIEIDGMTVASFSEVSGLTAEGDAVDYREEGTRRTASASSSACAGTG